jgi:hypothetical protein
VSEFDFRYNVRKIEDGGSTALAIRKADGKCVTDAGRIGEAEEKSAEDAAAETPSKRSTMTRRSALLDSRIIYLLMIVLFWGCNYFPESRFELAPDSRLPKWFILPKNLSRADVTVRMSYYIEPCGIFGNDKSLGCATFELWDLREYMHGKKQAVITEPNGIQYFGLLDMHGQSPTMSWEITSAKKLAAVDGNIREQENVGGIPSYVVVNADGITEVIEHRHFGDVFYVNEDPVIRAKLGLMAGPKGLSTQK